MKYDEKRRTSSLSRIPSLDGFRALSILFVLCAHVQGQRGFEANDFFISGIVNLGSLGVRTFFVISGFLITSLLLKEESKRGTIALGRFYFRRTLRIFPAYYVFVAIVLLVSRSGVIHVDSADFWYAATYTLDYRQGISWYLGHGWSLSIEEQFYLLWPSLLLLFGSRRAMLGAGWFVVVVPLVRIFFPFLPWAHLGVGGTFETAGDAIATGCLLAAYRDRLALTEWYPKIVGSWRFVFVVIAGILAASLGGGYFKYFNPIHSKAFLASIGTSFPEIIRLVHYGLGMTVTNVAIAITIDRYVRFPTGFLGRMLNARVPSFIGMISYSLYLWQQPFFNSPAHDYMIPFPVNVVAAVSMALISYYLIEHPFLRLREGLEERWRIAKARQAVDAVP